MRQGQQPSWASQPCLLGIDEAGRGPVLGPMVYGVAFCPLRCKEQLSRRAFADSKTLTPEKRDALFLEIEEDNETGFLVDCISAAEISAQMLRREKISLNQLAMESTFKLLDQVLALGVNLQEVFCDTVGDASKWQARLEQRFPSIKFKVCPKADALFPIVSAASIAAKVTRDRELKAQESQMNDIEKLPLGSGYPSDAVTVAWLRANIDSVFGFPDLVRFSWQTASKLLEEHAAKVSWEGEEDRDAGQQVLRFGASDAQLLKRRTYVERHSFFRSRKLQRVTDFSDA